MVTPIRIPLLAGADVLSIPTGPQISAKFELIGPGGIRVVFNDQKDPDYVGVLTNVTGLEGADVRESADDLVQMDGGVHGDFFFSRRPVNLEGIILNPLGPDDRNRKMTKFMQASNAMRADATLQWTLEGGYKQYVRVRRQQSPRFEGNWQKTFNVGLVAADPYVYGVDQYVNEQNFNLTNQDSAVKQIAAITLVNHGNTTAPFLFIASTLHNLTLINYTTGQRIVFNRNMVGGESVTADVRTRVVTSSLYGPQYSIINTDSTDWFGIEPGANTILIAASGATVSGKVQFFWRDTWI
jgi:hypothetical protein